MDSERTSSEQSERGARAVTRRRTGKPEREQRGGMWDEDWDPGADVTRRGMFLAECEHFAGFGWADERVAAAMGMAVSNFRRECRKLGVVTRDTAAASRRLSELVAGGGEFTANSFPPGVDSRTVVSVLESARKLGAVVRCGTAPNPLSYGNELAVYCAADSVSSVETAVA